MHCQKIETLTIIFRSNTIMPGLQVVSHIPQIPVILTTCRLPKLEMDSGNSEGSGTLSILKCLLAKDILGTWNKCPHPYTTILCAKFWC